MLEPPIALSDLRSNPVEGGVDTLSVLLSVDDKQDFEAQQSEKDSALHADHEGDESLSSVPSPSTPLTETEEETGE